MYYWLFVSFILFGVSALQVTFLVVRHGDAFLRALERKRTTLKKFLNIIEDYLIFLDDLEEDEVYAWKGFRQFYVTGKEKEHSEAISFFLKPIDNKPLPPFKAGQHINLNVYQNSQTFARCYSLSHWEENPSSYRLTLTKERKARFSISSHLIGHVDVGDTLNIGEPIGQFYVRDHNKPIIFFVTSIGISPVCGMLHSIPDDHEAPIMLFHVCRNYNVVPLRDEVEEICKKKNILHVLWLSNDQEKEGNPRLPETKEVIDVWNEHVKSQNTDVKLQDVHLFYCCNPAVTKAVLPDFFSLGIQEDNFFYECFDDKVLNVIASVLNKGDELEDNLQAEDHFNVLFSISKKAITCTKKDTLLNEGLKHKLWLKYGCKTGRCGACMLRYSGEIDYLVKPVFKVEANHCLICIARPKSNIELEG